MFPDGIEHIREPFESFTSHAFDVQVIAQFDAILSASAHCYTFLSSSCAALSPVDNINDNVFGFIAAFFMQQYAIQNEPPICLALRNIFLEDVLLQNFF